MRRLTNIPNERWLAIAGYPGYSVSDLGRIKRRGVGGEFELQGKVDRTGYQQVGLVRDGKQTWFMVHRLVACTFIASSTLTTDPDHFLTVNHKDRCKLNNRLDNLELMTVSDNHRHWRKWPLAKMQRSL